MTPLTNWDAVPLVADITTTAKVLNTSTRSIRRALKFGTMQPPPMPRLAGGKWQWSKATLQEWVDGGYLRTGIRRPRRKVA